MPRVPHVLGMLVLGAQILGPTLQVAPLRLTFISAEQTSPLPGQRIQIRNSGSGQLVWRALRNQPWITVTPPEGFDEAVALIGIEPAGLAPGTHSGQVRIEAGRAAGSPKTIDITLTIAEKRAIAIAPPTLKVAPDKVAFSASVGHRDKMTFRVKIGAERDQAIRWTARSDKPWLIVTPIQGMSPTELTLTATPDTLPVGDHTATVSVRAGNADATPIQIPVTLSVRSDGGPMTFSSSTLSTATLNVPYSRPIPVKGGRPPYTLQVVSGTLPPEMTLANGSLTGTPRQPGVFTFTVAASDSSNPPVSLTQQVSIAVVVLDQNTALGVRPATIDLQVASGKATESTLAIVSGGAPLTWQASADVPWLRITPADGVAPAGAKVSVETKGLASGTYAAVITISMDGAPNSPVRIPVRMTVR